MTQRLIDHYIKIQPILPITRVRQNALIIVKVKKTPGLVSFNDPLIHLYTINN